MQIRAVKHLVAVVALGFLRVATKVVRVGPFEVDRSAGVAVEERVVDDVVKRLPVVGQHLARSPILPTAGRRIPRGDRTVPRRHTPWKKSFQ